MIAGWSPVGWPGAHTTGSSLIIALCDALEAARAERDSAIEDGKHQAEVSAELRERAERAEDATDLMRREAVTALLERDRAEDALTRVRDLCDDVDESRPTHPFASTVEIRAALDGDQ